jgi:dTDP-4-dehydrorhamnose 3,5-epimerase
VLFHETKLAGAYVIEIERRADERGFFARTFCEREFAAHRLPTRFPQSNLSYNRQAGTLRGMHYQANPYRESKLIRCATGSIYDVIVDLRPSSPTRLEWVGVELTAESGRALFVPEGFAHGFITLSDDTNVTYQMGEFYQPDAARGIRWNDPCLSIRWPREPAVIAERDASYPDFDPAAFDG